MLLPAILVAVPVHELAHALVAQRLGDNTPRSRGFLRPDPRQFIEPYGLLAILLIKTGWGKQAPINEYRLRSTGPHIVYALAGPAANLALGAVFGVLYRLLFPFGQGFQLDTL